MGWRLVRCERGQTAAEYLGVLLVVAAIIAALGATDLHGRIFDAFAQAMCTAASDEPKVNCGPGADERFAQAAREAEQQEEAESGGLGRAQPSWSGAAQEAPRLDAAQARVVAQRSLMAFPLGPGGSAGPARRQAVAARPVAALGVGPLATPTPRPPKQDEDGGNALDGAGNALEDLGGELLGTAEGLGRHLTFWDPGAAGDQWAQTAGTVGHVATHPLQSARSVADSFVTPIEQAYAQGGLDQAAGHGVVGAFGAVAGGKGLNKLGNAAPDAPPAPAPRRDSPGPQRPDQRDRRNCVSNSFTAQTPVLLADGTQQAIAQVQVGDQVLATDPHTAQTTPATVRRVIIGQGPKTLVRIRADGQTLTATAGHPIWAHSRGAWVDAEDLRPGDRLRTPHATTTIDAVHPLAPRHQRVYNLTVNRPHTYYAGHQPTLAHNCHQDDDGQGDGDGDEVADGRLEIAQEVRDKVPSSWGAGAPTRKGGGTRWSDPVNRGNGLRIDPGDPTAMNPSQRVDHVVVRSDGKVLGRDGQPIGGSIREDPLNAHIPLSEYRTWTGWNSR